MEERVLHIRLIFAVEPACSPKSHRLYKGLHSEVLHWSIRFVFLYSQTQERIEWGFLFVFEIICRKKNYVWDG